MSSSEPGCPTATSVPRARTTAWTATSCSSYPKAGATLADVVQGFQEEFSTNPKVAAKGTRDLTRDAWFFGLAQVSRTTPATVTRRLRRGSYYLLDLGRYPATCFCT